MLIDPEEVKEDVHRRLARKDTDIQIVGDSILVNLGYNHPYEIPLHDVNSDSDIVRWVLQLCSKNGADTVTIESFIEKMQSHRHS